MGIVSASPDIRALVHNATPQRPLLALAPMEGISDAIVRELLSGLGGMDLCVTEFIRVQHRPVPIKVLKRDCPELLTGGLTASGVPVVVQLLGGDPEPVASTAATAAELGALGIDLNFGCPARTVNGSDGGAALLKTPGRVRDVVAATRAAVPAALSVSAKIRLGWDDPDDVVALVRAAEAGGADWVTIHGRTKVQMYKPFADWGRIRDAVKAVQIPVIANGDIFDPEALQRCQEVTGAHAFMLGRGAFRRPNLFRWMTQRDDEAWPLERCIGLLYQFVAAVRRHPRFRDGDRSALARLKQWSNALRDAYPDMHPVFDRMKRTQTINDALRELEACGFDPACIDTHPPTLHP